MAGTPSDPGGPPGYALNWQRAADRTLPAKAPAGWVIEYDVNQRHNPGNEPQARAAAGPVEPVRSGTHSVRFQLYKGDKRFQCGVRSELAVDPPEPPRSDPARPVERWYGFSIFLPYTWQPDPSPESVTQWHQDGNSTGGSPPLAILTMKPMNSQVSHWFISQRKWDTNDTINTDAGPCALREWTDWVVHVKWSAGADGLVEIWKNGVPVPGFNPKNGKSTFSNSTRHYMKIGIYKWQWNRAAPPQLLPPGSGPCGAPGPDPSASVRRAMYHDEVRIVDGRGSRAVVAPPGNRPPPVPLPP